MIKIEIDESLDEVRTQTNLIHDIFITAPNIKAAHEELANFFGIDEESEKAEQKTARSGIELELPPKAAKSIAGGILYILDSRVYKVERKCVFDCQDFDLTIRDNGFLRTPLYISIKEKANDR